MRAGRHRNGVGLSIAPNTEKGKRVQETTWYYMDSRGQRQGPVATAAVVAAYRSGDLLRDGLAWHDGMPQWLPLRQMEVELGLGPVDHASAPPPLPEGPTRVAAATRSRESDRNDIVYAGFARRFAALFVDGLVLVVPGFVLGFLLGIPFAILMHGYDERTRNIAQFVFGMVVGLLLRGAYFAVMESSKEQGTIGKRALGIKVTDDAGGKLTFTQALGRWFAASLSYLTLYIGFFMAGFTDRKRALHDMVAGTLVVDRWAFTEFPERQQRSQAGVLVAVIIGGLFLGVAVLGILAAIAIPAYQDYIIRSQVQEGVTLAEGSKTAMAEFYSNKGYYPPSNASAGVAASTSIQGNYVDSVTIDSAGVGSTSGTITVHYGNRANMAIANHSLVFKGTQYGGATQFTCTTEAGTTLNVKFRPTPCRP